MSTCNIPRRPKSNNSSSRSILPSLREFLLVQISTPALRQTSTDFGSAASVVAISYQIHYYVYLCAIIKSLITVLASPSVPPCAINGVVGSFTLPRPSITMRRGCLTSRCSFVFVALVCELRTVRRGLSLMAVPAPTNTAPACPTVPRQVECACDRAVCSTY